VGSGHDGLLGSLLPLAGWARRVTGMWHTGHTVTRVRTRFVSEVDQHVLRDLADAARLRDDLAEARSLVVT